MTCIKRHSRLTLAALAATVLLSGCGAQGSGGGNAPDPVSIAIGGPTAPLVPGNTVEEYGTQILQSLWTGLVEYEADGEVSYTGVAKDISSPDNVTRTIELNDGWTFHDGTPVTAASFVDAWNYTAYSPNAQSASYFFANVEGFGDLQAETDDEDNIVAPPAAKELSGLEVVDDTTFTVTLDAPFAQFPVTLGYSAFY